MNSAQTIILIGGFIGQKYFNLNGSKPEILFTKTNPNIRILTINGELDNSLVLSAESFFLQLTSNYNTPSALQAVLSLANSSNLPMVVIPGMNHVQVADGSVTGVNWILRDNELRSEITLEHAHDQIAGIVKQIKN